MSENQLTVVAPSIVPAASTSTAQVCAALAAAQGKFTNPKRTKTATVRPRDGGAGYTFSYAPLEEVVNAIKEGLAENGLSRQQYLFRGDDGTYWLRTVLWHSSGEWISGDYPVLFSKDSAQGFAGGVTYAKRNGLSLLLGLAAEDDDDGNDADGNAVVVKPALSQQAQRARQPKPPAENVMVNADGEVIEKPTKQLDEAYQQADLRMMAAIRRGGTSTMQAEWKSIAEPMQRKLQPEVPKYLKMAREIDEAHKMAQEIQR